MYIYLISNIDSSPYFKYYLHSTLLFTLYSLPKEYEKERLLQTLAPLLCYLGMPHTVKRLLCRPLWSYNYSHHSIRITNMVGYEKIRSKGRLLASANPLACPLAVCRVGI